LIGLAGGFFFATAGNTKTRQRRIAAAMRNEFARPDMMFL
jgi:hypothetical protein